jgi:hypothetical protein
METTTDLAALNQRLTRLEGQNRRLRVGALGLALATGAVLIMGSQDAANKPKPAEADRFSLKDANGKERARLAMGSDGPVLQFLDENGRERVGFLISNLGMVCRYVDPRGSLISGFSLERSGVALVNYDQNGRLQSSSNALKPDAGLLGPTR